MGTAADKLNYLMETKEEIRTAIIGRGVAVPDGTTFRQYAALIGSIVSTGESGGVTLPDTPSGAPGTTIIPNTPENTVKPSDPETPVTPYDPDKPEEMEVPKNIIESTTGQSADTFDVMILQNGTGDVTYGFLEKGGMCSYNGTVLPELPEWDKTVYPHAWIHNRQDSYTLLVVAKAPYENGNIVYNVSSPYIEYQLKSGEWIKSGSGTTSSSANWPLTMYTIVWTNFDLLNVDGAVYLAASAPTEYKGFEITWYDPSTTNFKAKGWRRLSYHRQGDYWQSDDFTTVESGGWNYLKNITECTREALYYNGVQVWPDDGSLAFTSVNPFTISVKNNTAPWDGTLEYSTDHHEWTAWDGTAISAADNGEAYALYFRGTGNTVISGGDLDTNWVITGTDVKCIGNILCLLDYKTVKAGLQPAMAASCFYHLFSDNRSITQAPALPAMTLTEKCYGFMFAGCWNLTQAPALPATTLADGCYTYMFSTCYGLTQAPVLPALTLAQECYKGMFSTCRNLTHIPALPALTMAFGCYKRMFYDCEKIKLSTSKTGEYTKEYRIPIRGTGINETGYTPCEYMFGGTGGTYTSNPELNTTYYLSSSNTIV